MEFDEKVHHRNNVKGDNARNKMDGRWHEGYYLGTDWRTGSAWTGTSAGVIKASVIRRTGAHRRWDQEGELGVRGIPWNRVPAAEDEYPEIIIELLLEAERRAVPPAEDHRRLPRRIMLRKENFVQHGFLSEMSWMSRSSVRSVSKVSWAPYRRVPKENGKRCSKKL